MCLNFHLRQIPIVVDMTNYVIGKNFSIPRSANKWINDNLEGEDRNSSAVKPILELYRCTFINDIYKCEED